MSISMINGTFFCDYGQTGWYFFWIGYKKKKKQRLWFTWSFLTGMSERRNIFRINNINIKGEVKKCYISLKFHLISASCKPHFCIIFSSLYDLQVECISFSKTCNFS